MGQPRNLGPYIVLFIVVCVVIAFLIPGAPETPTVSGGTLTPSGGPPPQNVTISGFCLDGCPAGASSRDELVTHGVLELDNNPETKFADWVAYKITPDTLGSGCKRIWKADPDLPTDATLRPSDYTGMRDALQSDRGHQAPLASLCGSPYWAEADYLSNITPQKSDLNEGTWERLENAERKIVEDDIADTVYSITGPLYEKDMQSLPRARLPHKVPSGYWKVVSIIRKGTIETAGFVMPQDLPRETNFCDTHIALSEIEKRSHLHFFPTLDPATAGTIKANPGQVLRDLGC